MSSITTNSGDSHGHGDGEHGHHPFLAHHFDTPEQQYTTGKLGMWVFLGTELLMFGGLFCAYAVYRHNHPEVFEYAHTYLNKWWGAVNTVVLLVSSFTMAWAVRCSQLGKKGPLCVLLALTLLGGAGFMVIKTIEYNDKWHHHLFPGRLNKYNADYTGDAKPGHHEETAAGSAEHAVDPSKVLADSHSTAAGETSHAAKATAESPVAAAAPGNAEHAAAAVAAETPAIHVAYFDPNSLGAASDAAKIVPKSGGPAGLAESAKPHAEHLDYEELAARDKARINVFFSIYFMMTGLHGIHVLVGMGLISWVLVKSTGGIFGPSYYTPVDLVGLYWHLVDLIWIFLFPLLYLIH